MKDFCMLCIDHGLTTGFKKHCFQNSSHSTQINTMIVFRGSIDAVCLIVYVDVDFIDKQHGGAIIYLLHHVLLSWPSANKALRRIVYSDPVC